jgi:uncharacterized hydrophobic protein (TIGR00271 family)
MTDVTPEPILLISEQADTETMATLEAELAKAKASELERRTLDRWLADARPQTRLICLLSDAELRRLLADERMGEWQIAILPIKTNRTAQVSFGVPASLGQALKGALEMENPTRIDLLTCNGQVMLGTLIIGNVWGLHSPMTKQNLWRDLVATLGHLRSLRLQPFSITTGKGQKQDLAAMGVTVFGHSFAGLPTTAIHQALIPNDGKLNAFILSPTSVLSHLWFLLKLRFQRPLSMRQLPDSVGFIRSQSLTITSQRPLAATLDGQTMEASEWHIEVRKDAAAVFIDKRLEVSTEEGDTRDSLRTSHLPNLAASRMLRNQPLPFLPHAEEADFRELFLTLRSNAELSAPFVLLMILSTLLASTGLFLNSASVIIGAMILAPLMSPIISLSMGIVRSDRSLVRPSLKTLAVGLSMGLVCAAVFALLTPLRTVTPEMASRLNPSLLDLMVALLSGVAGAYAHAKEEIARSLAGVAIAVALVPPLAVVGIGMGWMDTAMMLGASLLLITNLIGIMLASSVTFILLGFAPISRARKALRLTLALMLLVTIPLGLRFDRMVDQNAIHDTLSRIAAAHPEDGILDVREVILSGKKPLIRLDVRVRQDWNEDMMNRHKARIEQALGCPADLEFAVVHVR